MRKMDLLIGTYSNHQKEMWIK